MAETNQEPQAVSREDIIAAFDRERDQVREWNRRHSEQIHSSRAHDRPVYIERRRTPR